MNKNDRKYYRFNGFIYKNSGLTTEVDHVKYAFLFKTEKYLFRVVIYGENAEKAFYELNKGKELYIEGFFSNHKVKNNKKYTHKTWFVCENYKIF